LIHPFLGGLFDKEFEKPTHALFDFIENKRIKIIYSDILEEELELAPEHIKLKATNILLKAEYIEVITEEMIDLARTYMKVGTLTEKSANDALHIAVAIIAGASAIITWNFKHMANFIKIQQYNAINLQEGYRMINIHSPMEIIE
jgi:predicted nucleic acid-binding protein